MLVALDGANRKLILGLERENMEKLANDMPIEKRLGEVPGLAEQAPELAGWTLYVLGPEDLERLLAHAGVKR